MCCIQLYGAKGFLDMYVGEPFCWGFEFLRDEDQLQEHINRFAKGGTYHRMIKDGKLKKYAVIDLRATSTEPPSLDYRQKGVPVVHVSFKEEYSMAQVQGMGPKDGNYKVAGQQNPVSNSSSVPISIRST